MDRISELPDNIVETIMPHLPLRDAVRTSILSKKWQYRWATVSTVTVDELFYATHRRVSVITYPCLVKTILLQHIGCLKKFVIYVPALTPSGIGEIDLIIRVALMKGVEELTVVTSPSFDPYTLPSFIFSCGDKLTKLKLVSCAFNPPHGLRVLSNLKSLHLHKVMCSSTEMLFDFISSSPKLHTVILMDFYNSVEHLCIRVPSIKTFSITGSFGSVIFHEPRNLVSLKICIIINKEDTRKLVLCDDYMHKFLSNLGKIEYLSLGGYMLQLLGGDCDPRKCSTQLDNLKTIEVSCVYFGDKREVDSLLFLIRSSPNLQVLEIEVDSYSVISSSWVENVCDAIIGEYLDWCFQHLRTVRISKLMGTKSELKMIELLLSCSPVLEIMYIGVDSRLGKDAKLEVSKELMRFPRSSITAQIIWRCTWRCTGTKNDNRLKKFSVN